MSAKKKKPVDGVAVRPVPRRSQEWPSLLAGYIAEHREKPFEWGVRDCCLFACGGIRAITGLDPAAKVFRGKYHDATGAARLLKKHGGVEAVAVRQCAEFGFEEVPVAFARRGDVLLMDTERGPAVGLCDGPHGVFAGLEGLQLLPVGQCRRAWRVN